MSGELSYYVDEDAQDLVGLDQFRRNELLSKIEEIGSIQASAAESGLTMPMLVDAMDADPDLRRDLELARGKYEAGILRRLSELAFKGTTKPVIGGRGRDKIVAWEDCPNDKALELLAKMHFAKELATITRSKAEIEVLPGKSDNDQQMDVSKLSREDRHALDELISKTMVNEAKKIVDKSEG